MDIYENILKENYQINSKVINFVDKCEEKIKNRYEDFSKIAMYNQVKILKAMQDSKLQSTDFSWTTGYGYGDAGRDKAEKIYADVFKTEDALVRPNIVNGTHAISLAISSNLESGDHLLSLSGRPYDTLQKVIGLTSNNKKTLLNRGIEYSEVPLIDGHIDLDSFKDYLRENTKIVMIQRSTGYSNRAAFSIDEIDKACRTIRKLKKDLIIFVDNCYGEFTDIKEPSELDVDLMAGSLIKNPGGGLAYSGGYIVGKKNLIENCASFLTAPGIGKDCGLTFGMTRQVLQGFFISPKITEDALKIALLFSKAFEELEFYVIPKSDYKRSDIITAIRLESPEILEEFCKFIQFSSPVDSQFTPMPWDMPGYKDKVIMAAGGFIEGSSIELSADGPMRYPYYVYFQGGLTYYHGKIALLNILNSLNNKELIKIK
ncbi:methionine gamma-lyase family protein [uncultured Peptoniphilus sp.]|uniref:methionine gamma-lyase family protein n=1 Tax=uncultured Peptoniphilus sp. TaxID=254354 RepID=UPI002804AB2E|nr:methionine gamma-lyase family protein [uncultured Peptoniphilus sp.]